MQKRVLLSRSYNHLPGMEERLRKEVQVSYSEGKQYLQNEVGRVHGLLTSGIDITENLIQNGAYAVGLYKADGADFPQFTSVTDYRLVDAVVYGTGDPMDVELFVTLLLDGTQLDEDAEGTKGSECFVHLDIADNGVGIPEDAMSKIFDPFYTTKTGEQGGVGLGLSIVNQIVKAHHGRLKIESEVNKGTTVSVRLPTV